LPDDVINNIDNAINSLELSSTQPQSVSIGLFHELDNGYQITLDAVWVDFSEFGVSEMSIVGQDLVVGDTGYNDIKAVSIGLQFPQTGTRAWRIGALSLNQAVDDEERTFYFALDRMHGVGAGFFQELNNGNAYSLNVNLLDTGESPIDTGFDAVRGRVAGESENHCALPVDFSYHWR